MSADRALSDSLVLRLNPSREADLVVTLFDREAGKIDAWARSGRKRSKRFGGRLELFQRGAARVRAGRGGLPSLTAFERTESLAPRDVDWPRLCLASYIAELAAVAAQPAQSDGALFDWAVDALRLCDRTRGLNLAALLVDLSFLRAIGGLPALATCMTCGGPTLRGASWPDATEGLVCGDCATPTLTDAHMEQLLRLLRSLPEAAGQELPRRAGVQLRTRADRLLADVLPRPLRTRAALQEALGGV